jgi:acetylornithine deacetylase/succinyl-diaminopimelate desuccinylase-like protein
VHASITERRFAPAVSLGTEIVGEFCGAAADLGMKIKKMPSWAGHDAKIMASITKCGMLFVTSLDGISHSPEEKTRWDDVAVGLRLFNETLQRVASIKSAL